MDTVNLVTTKGLPVVLRVGRAIELAESERNLVLATWLRGYGRAQYGRLERSVRNAHMERLDKRTNTLLYSPTTRVCLAGFADPALAPAEQRIVGWCAYAPSCVHYVYVRTSYRHGGLGSVLVSLAHPRVATHWSKEFPPDGVFHFADQSIVYVGFEALR